MHAGSSGFLFPEQLAEYKRALQFFLQRCWTSRLLSASSRRRRRLSVCRAPSAAAQRVSCLARYLQRSLPCTTPASQPNPCTETAKRDSTKLEPRGGQILGSLVLQLLAIDPDPAESRSIESVHMYCSNHGPLASFPHSHTFPTSFLCVRPLNGIDAKGELVLPFSPAGGGSTRQRPGPVI